MCDPNKIKSIYVFPVKIEKRDKPHEISLIIDRTGKKRSYSFELGLFESSAFKGMVNSNDAKELLEVMAQAIDFAEKELLKDKI